ncbi:hypothetical protein [Nannocystis bainbridge]|uniref:Uncharacterized protein n=1 Tax=Nannocystis bainbridge TaxID=2995303 RepID=A0ABT5DV70_9BACT|nr:hypothetical protein [Nannocystis bainbridge]MDC0717539.1 hypothetical protein [Nannocystis bainbridge]
MRTLALGAALLCGAACIPFEPYWLIQDARVLGTRMTVVEPGGYSTLVQVPYGQRRASGLPLDTVELEWMVAAVDDDEVQPPIWLACTWPNCIDDYYRTGHALYDCPHPLPLDIRWACRLGEGHTVRVGFAGAFGLQSGFAYGGLSVMAIGSRTPEVASAACLERYGADPHAGLEKCLIARDIHVLGPLWAVLPFAPELGELPLEIFGQEPDTHPDIVGFRVTRERGPERLELLVELDDTVSVEPGEHITVLPLVIGGAQEYSDFFDGDTDGPAEPELHPGYEFISTRVQLTALVDEFAAPEDFSYEAAIEWLVPEHPEPMTMFVSTRDNRAGRGFARLHFVSDDR